MKKFDLLEIIRKGTLEPIGDLFRLMNEHGKHIATFRFERDNDRVSHEGDVKNLSFSEKSGTIDRA